jgi:hypothetical protein
VTLRRRAGTALAAVLLLAACQVGAPSSPPSPAGPGGTAEPTFVGLLTARFDVGPRPGPVKPFRGEMQQDVVFYGGYASMRFVLRNTGEEPVTFLNTLYDYEPFQLYEPLIRLEWTDGSAAVTARSGRFFPSPAILQPGEEAVYLLGGAPISGSGGELGDLISHIKYCPARGMDDQPALPLEVSDLAWSTDAAGVTTVSGTLRDVQGVRRATPPAIGIEFQDADGNFVGAVVEGRVGDRLDPNETRSFEISGLGVRSDAIVSAIGYAWVN